MLIVSGCGRLGDSREVGEKAGVGVGGGDRGLMGCRGGPGICWGVPSSRLRPVWQAQFFSFFLGERDARKNPIFLAGDGG